MKGQPGVHRLLEFRAMAWIVPLLVALTLVATMASVSGFNAHPDEVWHARAADYYQKHWLPPRFADPAAMPSYSQYGASYLHERDIVYLLAGKWYEAARAVIATPEMAYRLVNVGLFGVLALVFAWKREARPLLVPVLLSAQVWYIFSYFNADAFALVAALLTGYQVAARRSAFNAALDGAPGWRQLGGIALLGLGLGMLLLAKRNYYVFIAFVAAYLALREIGVRAAIGASLASLAGMLWVFAVPLGTPAWLYLLAAAGCVAPGLVEVRQRLASPVVRRRVVTCSLAACVGLALFTPRFVFDKWVVENPANRFSSGRATAEALAEDGFKPSQAGKQTGPQFPILDLRGQKTSLGEMLVGDHAWLTLTGKSSVGLYGWMAIASSARFYIATGVTLLAFVLSVVYWAWRSKDRRAQAVLAFALMFSLLVFLMSALHSWTSDFQPQGRYLFPIVAMLGVAIAGMPGRQPLGVTSSTAAAFMLAAYSFVNAGLGSIPRI